MFLDVTERFQWEGVFLNLCNLWSDITLLCLLRGCWQKLLHVLFFLYFKLPTSFPLIHLPLGLYHWWHILVTFHLCLILHETEEEVKWSFTIKEKAASNFDLPKCYISMNFPHPWVRDSWIKNAKVLPLPQKFQDPLFGPSCLYTQQNKAKVKWRVR